MQAFTWCLPVTGAQDTLGPFPLVHVLSIRRAECWEQSKAGGRFHHWPGKGGTSPERCTQVRSEPEPGTRDSSGALTDGQLRQPPSLRTAQTRGVSDVLAEPGMGEQSPPPFLSSSLWRFHRACRTSRRNSNHQGLNRRIWVSFFPERERQSFVLIITSCIYLSINLSTSYLLLSTSGVLNWKSSIFYP